MDQNSGNCQSIRSRGSMVTEQFGNEFPTINISLPTEAHVASPHNENVPSSMKTLALIVPPTKDTTRVHGLRSAMNVLRTVATKNYNLIEPHPAGAVSSTIYEHGVDDFTNLHDHSALQKEPDIVDYESGTKRRDTIGTGPSPIPFDIFRALNLVATRRNPQTSLEAVHFDRSFVVVDAWQHDMPVIYVSNSFQQLTGYSREEIVGGNCRCLQSPGGRVEAGAPREHGNNSDAYHFSKMLQMGCEFRQTIVNYKKNKQRFINLVTIIPIRWDDSRMRFFFGFQVDVTNSIHGSPSIPLHIGSNSPLFSRRERELRQRVAAVSSQNDPVSVAWTSSFESSGEKSLPSVPLNVNKARHVELQQDEVIAEGGTTLLSSSLDPTFTSENCAQPWVGTVDITLLNRSDILVQVLSLTGIILYVSDFCKKLGYTCAEMLGTSLQEWCHPTDVSGSFRQLQNARVGREIDFMCRFVHHTQEYAWFHNTGSVWAEGGRKWVVLVGYQQYMPVLCCAQLDAHGGFGDRDFWLRISTSGLILAPLTSRSTALGVTSEQLVGTSFQDLLASDRSREDFQALLRLAKTGITHQLMGLELRTLQGECLYAATSMYSGGDLQSRMTSFILQCRISKSSRLSEDTQDTWTGTMTMPSNLNDDNLFATLGSSTCGILTVETRRLITDNNELRLELKRLQQLAKQRQRSKSLKIPFNGCANCHTRQTPEWRRGPSGERDLCNRCGLRWTRMNSTK